MLKKQPLPLNEFIDDLQTFDIVLMHGIFSLSLISEQVEGSPYSHVGVVVVAKDLIAAGLPLNDVPPETRLFWESNVIDSLTGDTVTSPPLDVILNAGKNGPQLTRLIDRITYDFVNNYDTLFASRKLTLVRTPEMLHTLVELIQQVHGDLFPVAADGTYLDGQNFQRGRFQNLPVLNNTFFCSQLTARTYMNTGLMSEHYVDNSYGPGDFSVSPDVSLFKGAWLGSENMIDTSTISKVFPIPAPTIS